MQIPIQLPEVNLPQSARRENQALTPVTAIAGLPELAETLSPHVALQWTQPVMQGQRADISRSAVQSAVSHPTPTAPADASGPNDGNAPASLTHWTPPGEVLTQLLRRTQSAASFNKPSPWPDVPSHAEATAAASSPSKPDSALISQAFQQLLTALVSSDVFAARKLVTHWYGPERENPSPQDTSQAGRWVQALSPDSEAAQQATHMLMTGQMAWQGDLLPGIPVSVQRQDSWRENTPGSGRLEKGASLSLEIELPHLGPLKIIGHQWGEQLDVMVRAPRQGHDALKVAWSELQRRLETLAPGRMSTHWQTTE